MVSFTGSVAVGKLVGQQAMRSLKKVVLELGGKSPNILLPTASVADAVGPSLVRYIRNSGQGCGATTRTLVPRAMYGEYAAACPGLLRQARGRRSVGPGHRHRPGDPRRAPRPG